MHVFYVGKGRHRGSGAVLDKSSTGALDDRVSLSIDERSDVPEHDFILINLFVFLQLSSSGYGFSCLCFRTRLFGYNLEGALKEGTDVMCVEDCLRKLLRTELACCTLGSRTREATLQPTGNRQAPGADG